MPPEPEQLPDHLNPQLSAAEREKAFILNMKKEAKVSYPGYFVHLFVVILTRSRSRCVQAKEEAAAKAEAEKVAAMEEDERKEYLEKKRKEAQKEERRARILNRQLRAYGGKKKARASIMGKRTTRGRGRRGRRKS